MGKVKMTRCPEECGKQWTLEQRKSEWQKQKKEERKGEAGRKQDEIKGKQKKEKKKLKKEYRMEVKKVAEEWEIWNKAAKLEEEVKKLVLAKLSISGSMSLVRRQVNGCPQETCRIMQ